MIPIVILTAVVSALTLGGLVSAEPSPKIAPKVMIISMWTPEAKVWYDRFPESGLGNLTSQAIEAPGLSMLFPRVYCTQNSNVCQLTVGEGEINSAASMMALVLSNKFDLSKTYFLLAGIAGVNPRHATIGSVALSRYAVQVALQYEIDPRSLPPTGQPVFELNDNLRDAAYHLASKATLRDDEQPQKYRSMYAVAGNSYRMAIRPPTIVKCDSATSDVYYSGMRLAQAFENTTTLWTNGTGVYCMSAQEDNATLEVLIRAAIQNLVDFGRIIAMRTGSNFDRPPPERSDWQHLTDTDQNGFHIAIDNIYNAGIEIVKGILVDWNCTYKRGIAASNYIGDIFGSLGGHPDFGFGSITDGKRIDPARNSGASAVSEMDRRRRFGKRAWMKA
ncbi:Purine nucleoside permease [Cladobotryum mycophilum]|uniref:Purine nucleoside permease n=1 Tax=Cladobotryum mycophilum TaxID=491253 RepID=A0ABR0SLE7_9HYPO